MLSPDGRTLAITVDTGTNPMLRELDIVLLDVEDGTITDFATGEANEVAPRFSSDGRWIAYETRVNGQFDIWLIDPPGPAVALNEQTI